MTKYHNAAARLRSEPTGWLVTGCAGFIGSNLAIRLIELGQKVVGLDNLSTGNERNIRDVIAVARGGPGTFLFVEGDVRNLDTCREACEGVGVVLHQAALGSVPRSIDDPIATNASNVTGFLNMLVAAQSAGIRRFVYAASSSTYGDHPGLPKVEDVIGKPLSPYAVTKYVNELYAEVFHRLHGMEMVGLRYFNVFGPRQDPDGAYAAVIPRWVGNLLRGRTCRINGDGETSRDFTYVENVLQANLLVATAGRERVAGEVFNVAAGQRATLNELYRHIRDIVAANRPELAEVEPEHGEFRSGDVKHSLADIGKLSRATGYEAIYDLAGGLRAAVPWYIERETESGGASTAEPPVAAAAP